MLSESLKGVVSQVLCRQIGGGRVAAMEVLLATPAVSNLIREAKTFQIPSVIQTSRRLGMVTLNDALLDLVDKKLVDVREAYVRCADKNALVQGLIARGHDASFAADTDKAGGAGSGRASGSPAKDAGSGLPGRGAAATRTPAMNRPTPASR